MFTNLIGCVIIVVGVQVQTNWQTYTEYNITTNHNEAPMFRGGGVSETWEFTGQHTNVPVSVTYHLNLAAETRENTLGLVDQKLALVVEGLLAHPRIERRIPLDTKLRVTEPVKVNLSARWKTSGLIYPGVIYE